MKPQEALELLDRAIAQLSANREVHVKLQEAITVLAEAIKPPTAKEEKKDKE
jgi:hypothetical protein